MGEGTTVLFEEWATTLRLIAGAIEASAPSASSTLRGIAATMDEMVAAADEGGDSERDIEIAVRTLEAVRTMVDGLEAAVQGRPMPEHFPVRVENKDNDALRAGIRKVMEDCSSLEDARRAMQDVLADCS